MLEELRALNLVSLIPENVVPGQKRAQFYCTAPRLELNRAVDPYSRELLDRIFISFMERLKRKHPENLTLEEVVAVGDDRPIRQVALSDLVERPEEFRWQRVRVAGHLFRDRYGSRLAASADPKDLEDYRNQINLGSFSEFADRSDSIFPNDGMVAVEGVFLKYRGADDPTALERGRIDRLTKITELGKEGGESEIRLPKRSPWREVILEVDGESLQVQIADIDVFVSKSEIASGEGKERSELISYVVSFLHDWEQSQVVPDLIAHFDSDDVARETLLRMVAERQPANRSYSFLIAHEGYYFLVGDRLVDNSVSENVVGVYRWNGERFHAVIDTPAFRKVKGKQVREFLYKIDWEEMKRRGGKPKAQRSTGFLPRYFLASSSR